MKKRILCIFTSLVLGLSSFSVTVSAENEAAAETGYQQMEKDALAAFVSNLMSTYSKSLDNYDSALKGSHSDISLVIGDAGRSLASMMVPVDISWINDLKFSADVSMTEGQTKEIIDVLLNNTKICTAEVWADANTGETYVRVPELSQSYLTVNYADAIAAAEDAAAAAGSDSGEEVSIINSQEDLMTYFASYEAVLESLPDAEVLSNILNNYGNKIIQGFTEGASGTETITVSGIRQECTTYEGTIDQAAATSVAEDILSTAKEDADIKSLFPEDSKDTYKYFQTVVDSMLEDLSGSSSEDESASFLSKIWTDQNGTIVGRQLSIQGASETVPVLTWQAPQSENGCGLLLELNSDDSVITLSGSGTKEDSLLNGTYTLSIDATPYVSIEVSDYDTASAKEGYINGVYTFSILPDAFSNDPSYGSLSNFSLVLTLASDGVAGSCTADLQSGGASLCSMNVSADLGDGADLPALSDVQGTTYDTMNEEDMNTYMEEINLDTILENLSTAGMPDTFIEDIMAMTSGTENTYNEDTLPDVEESASANAA